MAPNNSPLGIDVLNVSKIGVGYTPTIVLGGRPTGGTPHHGHTRGMPDHTKVCRRQIQEHSNILRAWGKRLVVLAIRYRGSEENNKGNTLARESARHFEYLNVDLKRINGQTETV